MMLTQTYAKGTQATAGHIRRIRIDHLPHQIGILTQLIPTTGVGNRGADHPIRVANQVFGGGLNGNVDIEFKGFKENACRPGIVDHNDRLWRHASDRLHNCRYVMNFHGNGARGFEEHDFRIGLNQTHNA